MADLYKYGVAVHLYKPIVKRGVVDFAVSADWTPAAGDVKISKDGGAAANVTNLPSAITMGNTAVWDYSLTATELQAAKIRITVSDSATKAVEDVAYEIDTYGNASAQHAIDLNDAVRAGLTALPNAAAAAAGGLMVLGVNATATSFTAGLTVSNAGGDALTLSSGGANGSGLAASGNGTGAGIKATGGATGNGVQAVGGATSGSAIKASGTAGNAIGIEAAGQGSASGIATTGGATGHGLIATGGATSGDGLNIGATTSGHGINVAGVGVSKHGINAAGGGTTSHGINATGGGAGHGILATSGAGATGDGIKAIAASANGHGVELQGTGTGSGLSTTGGATGHGVIATGGATSGDGMNIGGAGAGHGINVAGSGASKHGIVSTGGGSGTCDGAKFVAGTGGVDFRANQTGNVTGNVTGSVGSVTGAVGSVTGAVGSVTGNVGGNVVGSVASVTGNVGGNVVGSVASVTAGVTVTTNNDKTGYALSAAGVTALWNEVVDGAFTARHLLRGFASALLGLCSGMATGTGVFRDISDTKDRLTVTQDANGNRAAITRDLT